jgi:ketosteroid isomerase-like protein
MDTQGLDATIQEMHSALNRFVTGDPGPLKNLWSHRDDVTVANPFGPAVRGWTQAAQTMERAARNYRDGEAVGFESVAMVVTPDLGYIVEVERYKVKVAGSPDLADAALRVTSIFRPEDGVWKLIHRHADPITAPRPAETVIEK